MFGNNICTNKFKRIYIPLVRDNDPTGNIFGRYYLPENPELENKIITGLQVNFGGDTISINNANYLLGNATVNLGSFSGFVNSFFLTLYDSNKNEKIKNMPVISLANLPTSNLDGKFFPVFGKINIPNSYLETFLFAASVPGSIVGFSLTFYYL